MMQTARLAGKTAIRLWLRQRRSVALPPPAIGEIRARLRALEEEGILMRRTYPEVPPRVEYALTDLGRDLMERVLPLMGWVAEHAGAMIAQRR